MRLILTTFILFLSLSFTFAQYPITDNFTSTGGVGEWYNASGGTDMCVESGTILCYNCTGNYGANQWYSWQSPDYGTQFSDDGCDSISFTWNVVMNIRGNDQFQFWYFDGGWNGYIVPSSGTWTINLPASTQYFSFDLVTGPGGGRNGRYVHIDWATVDCYSIVLPIELVFFNGEQIDLYNELKWLTASEINNSYFELYKSNDAKNWVYLDTIKGAGNSNIPIWYTYLDKNPYKGSNYYQLIQVDYDGSTSKFKIVHINYEDKYNNSKIINLYPNPVNYKQKINIELKGFNEEVLIIIMDVKGQVFYEKTVIIESDGSIIAVNSNLAPGIYLVVGCNKQELYQKKLIIK